jgi:hypothetical protein
MSSLIGECGRHTDIYLISKNVIISGENVKRKCKHVHTRTLTRTRTRTRSSPPKRFCGTTTQFYAMSYISVVVAPVVVLENVAPEFELT